MSTKKVFRTLYKNLLIYAKKYDSNINAKLLFHRRNKESPSSSSTSSSSIIIDYYNDILDKILTKKGLLFRPSSNSNSNSNDSLVQVVRDEFRSNNNIGNCNITFYISILIPLLR